MTQLKEEFCYELCTLGKLNPKILFGKGIYSLFKFHKLPLTIYMKQIELFKRGFKGKDKISELTQNRIAVFFSNDFYSKD